MAESTKQEEALVATIPESESPPVNLGMMGPLIPMEEQADQEDDFDSQDDPVEDDQDDEQDDQDEQDHDSDDDLESRKLWNEAAPDVPPDWFDKLEPAAQRDYLAKQLLRMRSAGSDAGTDDDSLVGGSDAASSRAVEMPQLNAAQLKQQMVDAIDTGDSEQVGDAFEQMMAFLQGSVQLLYGMSSQTAQQVGTIDRRVTQMSLPTQLLNVVDRVPGASERDLEAAQGILTEGRAASPEDALALAVIDRQRMSRRANSPGKTEAARRRAAAGLEASRHAGMGRRQGSPPPMVLSESFTSPQGKQVVAGMTPTPPQRRRRKR